MSIGFIGAGKVGQSLAIYFKSKSVSVSGFYGRHYEQTRMAVEQSFKVFPSLIELVENADVIGITVNDDQIESVIEDLLSLGLNLEDKYIFHTSGAHDVIALKQIKAHTFGFHPLKAFSKVITTASELDEIYFSLEGADACTKKWIETLNIHHFEIDSAQKVKYHAGAAIVSNYLVSVLDFGIKQFMATGIDEKTAQKALWPLIEGSLDNVQKQGTQMALTGPIVRGDVHTLEKHMRVLEGEMLQLYKQLGLYTLSMTHLEHEKAQQIRTLFEEESHE